MLKQVFFSLLDMSKTATLVIAIVVLVRLLLRRAPKWISYAMWIVVLFRLLCPVTFQSSVSALPRWAEPSAPAAQLQADVPSQPPEAQAVPHTPVQLPNTPVISGPAEIAQPQEQNFLLKAAPALWLVGVLAMFGYSLFSDLRLRRKLREAIPLRDNIWAADHISTPFVLGLVHPQIYLPSSTAQNELPYILLHEQHHIRRGDHIIKYLAFLALCLHWFNPLVWLAFFLSGKDMEMSCDEAVMKQLGSEIRADYAASLLRLSTGRPILAGTPLAFGEGGIGGRIKNLSKWKKPSVCVTLVASLLCLSVIAACAVDPTAEPPLSDDAALQALQESITYKEGTFTFSLPEGERQWNIHIAGRLEAENFGGLSRHFLEGTLWEPGKEYSFTVSDPGTEGHYTDLFLDASLGDAHQKSIDLLPYLAQPTPSVNQETRTPFDNIMNLSGYYIEPSPGTRLYFSENNGLSYPIGYGWGGEYFVVDLDGDGVSELVCNCVTGGDGHASAVVYRRTEDQVQVGTIQWTAPPDWNNWGGNSTREWFDPTDNRFYVAYSRTEKQEEGLWSCGYAELHFEPYLPYIMADFRDILQNNAPFLRYDTGETSDLGWLTAQSDGKLVPKDFAVLDLDRDGIPEVLVGLYPDDYVQEYLLLRRENGAYYGYSVPQRGLLELKEDGTYNWSAGAFDNGCSRITGFGPEGLQEETLFYVLGDQFFVGKDPVSRAAYEAARQQQEEKDDAVFLPLTMAAEPRFLFEPTLLSPPDRPET